MSALPHFNLTPEEYLELERKAEFRSEYSDGCARVMAGASENDNIITLNTASVLLANPRAAKQHSRGSGCPSAPCGRIFSTLI
jgi:hypothetical protein